MAGWLPSGKQASSLVSQAPSRPPSRPWPSEGHQAQGRAGPQGCWVKQPGRATNCPSTAMQPTARQALQASSLAKLPSKTTQGKGPRQAQVKLGQPKPQSTRVQQAQTSNTVQQTSQTKMAHWKPSCSRLVPCGMQSWQVQPDINKLSRGASSVVKGSTHCMHGMHHCTVVMLLADLLPGIC